MRRHAFLMAFVFTTISFGLQLSSSGQSPATTAQENTAPARFAYGGNAAQNPAAFIGNLIFLPVRIDQGKPLLFELDSSASATSVDPNYPPKSSSFSKTISFVPNWLIS